VAARPERAVHRRGAETRTHPEQTVERSEAEKGAAGQTGAFSTTKRNYDSASRTLEAALWQLCTSGKLSGMTPSALQRKQALLHIVAAGLSYRRPPTNARRSVKCHGGAVRLDQVYACYRARRRSNSQLSHGLDSRVAARCPLTPRAIGGFLSGRSLALD
jgi:hypothetical protein